MRNVLWCKQKVLFLLGALKKQTISGLSTQVLSTDAVSWVPEWIHLKTSALHIRMYNEYGYFQTLWHHSLTSPLHCVHEPWQQKQLQNSFAFTAKSPASLQPLWATRGHWEHVKLVSVYDRHVLCACSISSLVLDVCGGVTVIHRQGPWRLRKKTSTAAVMILDFKPLFLAVYFILYNDNTELNFLKSVFNVSEGTMEICLCASRLNLQSLWC